MTRRRLVVGLTTSTVAVLAAAAVLEGFARLCESPPAGPPTEVTQAASRVDPVAVMFATVNLAAPGLVEPDPVLGYRLRPGSTSPPYAINAGGYRGPMVGVAKPEGTYRVIALGGSTTFGWGLPEDDTYPRILEERLNQRCTPSLAARVEVINGGVPAYISRQEWIALHSRWLSYQPNLVILMTGLNDVAAAIVGPSQLRPPTLGSVAAQLRRVYEATLRYSVFARWYARQLSRWMMGRTDRAQVPAVAERAIHESLEGIQQLASAYGVRIVLVAYPGLSEEDASGFPVMGAGPEVQARVRSTVVSGLQSVMDFMQPWAASHGLPWVDPRGPFRERGPGAGLYLSDGMHFTRAGNELLVETIYDAVFKPRCAAAGT